MDIDIYRQRSNNKHIPILTVLPQAQAFKTLANSVSYARLSIYLHVMELYSIYACASYLLYQAITFKHQYQNQINI